ncbi:MAG: DUF4197 domain-containing protein, partial [Gammaproteobacteria bacterium]|nr:DUF4197 domain-containing protein [Gammaproteobacteria bacterium]
MTYPKKILATLLFVAAIYSTSAYADWRSLLEDLTSAGKELLSDNSETTSTLNYDTVVAGLKEALDVGARYAINNVSQVNGYLANDLIRIAMPPQLQQASDLMRKFGLSAQADQFEQSMNHAAERAAPQATKIIVKAIKDMSIEDANTILKGNDDAATNYFKTHTSDQLAALFRPSIENSLNQVGTTKYYNDLTNKIAALPLVGENIDLNLTNYVT